MESNHTSKDLININIGLNNMAYRQDDFSKSEAIKLATNAGADILLLGDMS